MKKFDNMFKPMLLIAIAIISFTFTFAQNTTKITGDSLVLSKIINQVITTHPSIKEANEAIANADAKIGLAGTNYNPNIGIESSYTRIGPVSEMSFPGLGEFKLFPENNYAAALKISQTLYDFGKTADAIAYETASKDHALQTIEQAKQKLSTAVISNYYAILYLQKAISIKKEQLKTLNEHLSFVIKKKETGSGTDYEILSTQVKISAIESQLSDLETNREVQLTILNSFMGTTDKVKPVIKEDLNAPIANLPIDSLIVHAFTQRDETKLIAENARMADLRYAMIKKQNAPSFAAFAEGGIKNGYIPDLNKPTPNFAVGISLRIPIYDAGRTKFNLAQAKTYIQSNNYELENLHRTITNDVIENDANAKLALKKIAMFEMQLKQARRALELAETSFRSGVITNLDLLDATTTVSESSLLLLKARIDFVVNSYKLKIALGERLY